MQYYWYLQSICIYSLSLSFSYWYLMELKLLQSLKNEATWSQVWVISSLLNWISRLKKYDLLSCIEFYSCYLQRCLSIDLLNPWSWLEGSYELGLSVFLSRSFLEIGSLGFFGTQHGVKGPCVVVCDRAMFFENNIFASKMEKMCQKWAKNKAFLISWEI